MTEKTAALPLFAGDEKSSGATATEKVAALVQARRQNSVTGGAEINFGGARAVYFVRIREGHGGTRNLSQSGSIEQGEKQRIKGIFRPKSQIQAVFPAENR